MKNRNFKAADYVNGKAPLPADFDTAYRGYLEAAREIVRLRRKHVARATAS